MNVLLWLPGQFVYSDLIVVPVIIIAIFLISKLFKPADKSLIKYYNKGLLVKVLGGLLFVITYSTVYHGGDSWAYFYSARAVGDLLISDFFSGCDILFSNYDSVEEAWGKFNAYSGKPKHYMLKDPKTFFIAKLTSVFCILGFKSFIGTSCILASLSFIGMWKFYSLVIHLYPSSKKMAFYFIICTPSLLFWGSGIMKDTFVLSSSCWFCYNFYFALIDRTKSNLKNLFSLIMNLFIVLSIKPYIVLSLLPGVLLWLNNSYLKKIRSTVLRTISFPIILIIISLIGISTFTNISELMGNYSNVDDAIQQAQIIQEDLLREEAYGSNSYNIGKIDGSLTSLLGLAPIAIFTSIFRPLPWEVSSPMMIISAIENSFLILLLFYMIIKISPLSFFKLLSKQPFLLFCLFFVLFFSFGVGIASTNFGALVRYKIPLMPFLLTLMYVSYSSAKHKIKNKKV